MIISNIDKSDLFFPQDADIEFEPRGHRYIYKGVEDFIPVSHLYRQFFEEFDSVGIARRKAAETGIPAEQFLEEWECNGNMASCVGTFMHKQIEEYFDGQEMQNTVHFDYNGKYVSCSRDVDISRELQHFLRFRRTLEAVPFRSEWTVFDPIHKVAGTIDLVCRTPDGKFEIFDWKRSKKLEPSEAQKRWVHNGAGPLATVQDTAFGHYCVQQNVYRYMLETFYGIEVKAMHLVVLHPDYDNFIIKDVPVLQKEIVAMLSHHSATHLTTP